jgi:hypothetical protein
MSDRQTIFETDNPEGASGTLAIDSQGHLYWNDRRVRVERPLRLTVWQRIGAFLTVASAVTVATISVLEFMTT